MLKFVASALTVLLVSAGSPAHAQTRDVQDRPTMSPTDLRL
jgi:hypothetical protein